MRHPVSTPGCAEAERGGARVAETDNVTVVWRGKYKELER